MAKLLGPSERRKCKIQKWATPAPSSLGASAGCARLARDLRENLFIFGPCGSGRQTEVFMLHKRRPRLGADEAVNLLDGHRVAATAQRTCQPAKNPKRQSEYVACEVASLKHLSKVAYPPEAEYQRLRNEARRSLRTMIPASPRAMSRLLDLFLSRLLSQSMSVRNTETLRAFWRPAGETS